MAGYRIGRLALALGMAALVAGCQDGSGPFATLQEPAPEAGTAAVASVGGEVEAPEVFAVAEPGLWDGRPSLGGVWVAHPDAPGPERVIVRNTENGKSVTAALFRRERDMPGPRLQVSSDAAAALDLLAGKPTALRVVVLRRPQAPSAAPAAAAPAADSKISGGTESRPPARRPDRANAEAAPRAPAMAPGDVAAPPAGTLAIPGEAAAVRAAAAPVPSPAPAASRLDRPFIQVGIFTIEDNARETAGKLREAGILPSIRELKRAESSRYRVLVGPSQSRDEQAALLETVKGLGYTDAYTVTK
ncbi:SPOR domain-containing protein [Rhodovulum strictum]|uniref:SPOR domain-containing protein n=1 Tax=Rhodovulum strictum TaxID=58314 RepID=A0A844B7I0_9RHOB|nr:SPOR domain-containing protein [Rhodovulum strictum]MRH22336.1 SPOR domain-containing protein [Rhodovulum strictum]